MMYMTESPMGLGRGRKGIDDLMALPSISYQCFGYYEPDPTLLGTEVRRLVDLRISARQG